MTLSRRHLIAGAAGMAVLPFMSLALEAANSQTVIINETSPAAGKSLGELDLRGESGATVIAVIRGTETKVTPGANYKLEPGDTVLVERFGWRSALVWLAVNAPGLGRVSDRTAWEPNYVRAAGAVRIAAKAAASGGTG